MCFVTVNIGCIGISWSHKRDIPYTEMEKYIFSGISKHYHRYQFYLISCNFFLFFINFSENVFFSMFRNIQLTSIYNYNHWLWQYTFVGFITGVYLLIKEWLIFFIETFKLPIWMDSIKVVSIQRESSS